MPHRPRVQTSMRRVLVAGGAIAGGMLMATLVTAGQQSPPTASRPSEPGVNAQAAGMVDFEKRLQAYLKLREDLSGKLKPLASTADSAELTARQESLAAAMKEARKLAKPGDLIPPPVAKQIAETVAADLKRRTPADKRSTLDEVPNAIRPAINRTYPASAALPTVPPLLLARLPKLPDNLQYRFYGRHILILDGDLQIIVDFVANALPPH